MVMTPRTSSNYHSWSFLLSDCWKYTEYNKTEMMLVAVLGTFMKFQKAVISFIVSVCPRETTASTGQILTKFIWVFFENPSRKFNFIKI